MRIQTTRGVIATLMTVALLLPGRGIAAEALTEDAELVETRSEIPRLKPAAEYVMQEGVLDLELSEYAGYAGLIVANGGLEPSADSLFAKHGLKVRIHLIEEENWSGLNSGRVGAAATTVDLLAAYGAQFDVTVPALIGFSRGADGVVVRSEIQRINDLRGKVVASCQFSEADFFIRYLAQEAGLEVAMLPDLQARPEAEKVNLVYCADAFGAGDLFLRDLQAGRKRLAGCVTWAPKTTEVAEASGGKARVLITNRNLLIVADILCVNRAFAVRHPEVIQGLVAGLMEGNHLVRTAPDRHLPVIAKAFDWTIDEARAELTKVHLANVPEARAFFAGTLETAGSFEYIYETARYVYGDALIGKAADPARLVSATQLTALSTQPPFKDQQAAIVPLRSKGGPAERNPLEDEALLKRDIRFYFRANSSKLDMVNKENLANLDAINQMLRVSPGSVVLLRGHADGSMLAEFRRQGGEGRVREMKLALKSLSKARCSELKQILQERHKVDAARLEAQGVGSDEPTGKGPDADRRVEVQWFTLE